MRCYITKEIFKQNGYKLQFVAISACFLRTESLPYPRTPTSLCSNDLPSFFLVCQCVDRFIDTLKVADSIRYFFFYYFRVDLFILHPCINENSFFCIIYKAHILFTIYYSCICTGCVRNFFTVSMALCHI